MELSIILAKVLGIFMFIVGAAILIDQKEIINLDKKLMRESHQLQHGLLELNIMRLLVGTVLVVIHSIWVMHWPVIITLLAWYIFARGAFGVLFPATNQKIFKRELNKKFYNVLGFGYVVGGAILIYLGFIYAGTVYLYIPV